MRPKLQIREREKAERDSQWTVVPLSNLNLNADGGASYSFRIKAFILCHWPWNAVPHTVARSSRTYSSCVWCSIVKSTLTHKHARAHEKGESIGRCANVTIWYLNEFDGRSKRHEPKAIWSRSTYRINTSQLERKLIKNEVEERLREIKNRIYLLFMV